MGVNRTVFIEANPAAYARLTEAMRGRPDAMTIHRAIDAKAGRVNLHLASSDRCASLLPLAAHLTIYPQIVPAGTVELDATTLDSLLNEMKVPVSQFNLLRVGVQGAEARVLQGAKDVLRHMDAVVIEVNFVELYHRCAQIEDIDGVLGPAGFRRVAMASPIHPSWAEAFYVRVAPGSA
jgi:FkbM family methyltransferase